MDLDTKPPVTPDASDPGTSGTPTTIKRRAPIACRRCRRMRSKCIHDKAQPPCKACFEAGLGPESCVFPVRGQPDSDRDYRHPRMRAEKSSKRDPTKVRREILDAPIVPLPVTTGPKNVKGADEWDLLPPVPEIIDAVNNFTRHYFQLGFIPKQDFPERLQKNHRSVSVFLLLSILSISARFTPSLKERFGNGMKAAETYMDRASSFALNELYQDPTIERCQAFYLLSIAQQGSALRKRSYINMGIAMRIAALLRLHREETYNLTNPTRELIIAAESARRTLWMLHSQDNLHSGPTSPVSLTASDITTLLPGNEVDFLRGQEPKSRAALEDTPPAVENPSLISDPGRSLFATLIQTHHFWGTICRKAVAKDTSSRPWEPDSEYAIMAEKLHSWEDRLPHDHKWSSYLLKGYKTEGQDLAYLGVTMVTRLCNIVLRKAYLKEMILPDTSQPSLQNYWQKMSLDLFTNVSRLFEQIDTQFVDRSPGDGMGAQMAPLFKAFCVYSCGLLATYLCKYPNICPDRAISREGPIMQKRTMAILAESQHVWPLASRWLEGLVKFAKNNKKNLTHGSEMGMADSKEPLPHVLHPPPTLPRAAPPPPPPVPQATVKDDSKRLPPPQPAAAPPPSLAGNPQSPPILPRPQPQSAPPATMYMDPATGLRLSGAASGPHAPPPPPPPPPPPAGMHALGPAEPPRTPINGLGLLLEAFDSHQQNPGAGYEGQPVPPGAYYGGPAQPPGAVTNDGYDQELQYYIEGAQPGMPGMGGWADAGMYHQY